MSFSPLVDTAIGVTFIFLVFSLLAAGIHEAGARLFEVRSKQLWRSLQRLVDGDVTALTKRGRVFQFDGGLHGDADVRPTANRRTSTPKTDKPLITTASLLAHPLIGGLDGATDRAVVGSKTRLSHIDPDVFSRAILDLLEPGADLNDEATMQALKDKLDGVPFGAEILALVNSGADTIEKLRDDVAGWFDTRMEALSKAYRRRTRWWIFAIAVVVSIGLNVNSVTIVDTLYNEDLVRAELVLEAEKCVADSGETTGATADADCMNELLDVPVWWEIEDSANLWSPLGWAISAAAIAQGGPFWFDVLRRLTGFKKAAMGG